MEEEAPPPKPRAFDIYDSSEPPQKAPEAKEAELTREDQEAYRDYSREMNKGRAYPINEYEHGAYLVDSEQEKIRNFSQIVDRAIQLANIEDPRLLILEQEAAGLLINFFSMALRDEGLVDFFYIRYYEWRSGLLLTKASKGGERKLQASIGTKYVTKERLTGAEFPDEEKEASLLEKILPRKKQQG